LCHLISSHLIFFPALSSPSPRILHLFCSLSYSSFNFFSFFLLLFVLLLPFLSFYLLRN
jgi:hypothetical protein